MVLESEFTRVDALAREILALQRRISTASQDQRPAINAQIQALQTPFENAQENIRSYLVHRPRLQSRAFQLEWRATIQGWVIRPNEAPIHRSTSENLDLYFDPGRFYLESIGLSGPQFVALVSPLNPGSVSEPDAAGFRHQRVGVHFDLTVDIGAPVSAFTAFTISTEWEFQNPSNPNQSLRGNRMSGPNAWLAMNGIGVMYLNGQAVGVLLHLEGPTNGDLANGVPWKVG